MVPLTFSQVLDGVSSAARTISFRAVDIVSFVLIFILIVVISWISNREIRKSKKIILYSDDILEAERNDLEKRISIRAKALIKAEEKHLEELERNAEFGKLSQGLFHDLISPLSSISLYSKNLTLNINNQESTKIILDKIIESSKRMGLYMNNVKKIIGNINYPENIEANIIDELETVKDLLAYKARMAGVEIVIKQFETTTLKIHQVRLHQIFINLVSNAIDSYQNIQDIEKPKLLKHKIIILVKKISDSIIISISDNGSGISPENLLKVFKQSFTTKPDGTGIGLMSVRSIVENDLNGSIEVISKLGVGTKFVIKVPINLK